MEIDEDVQKQSIWAIVSMSFILGFFLTVPSCVAVTTQSYNECIVSVNIEDQDRCRDNQ